MDIEEFALGNSFVHRVDPRVKIVSTFVFSTVVALSHWIPGVAAAIVFPIVLIVAAGIDLRRVLSRLAVVNTFILFLWLFLPFTFPGEVIHRLGPLEIHKERLLVSGTSISGLSILTVRRCLSLRNSLRARPKCCTWWTTARTREKNTWT